MSNKHIKVNGLIMTNEPSALKPGDIIEINEKIKPLVYSNLFKESDTYGH